MNAQYFIQAQTTSDVTAKGQSLLDMAAARLSRNHSETTDGCKKSA